MPFLSDVPCRRVLRYLPNNTWITRNYSPIEFSHNTFLLLIFTRHKFTRSLYIYNALGLQKFLLILKNSVIDIGSVFWHNLASIAWLRLVFNFWIHCRLYTFDRKRCLITTIPECPKANVCSRNNNLCTSQN